MNIEERLTLIEHELKEINHRFKLSDLVDDIGFTMSSAEIAADFDRDTAMAISILTKLKSDIDEKLKELRGQG